MTIITYKGWEFAVDRQLTEETYQGVLNGGADACGCDNCKNYVASRESIFPNEVKALFQSLGMDYRKEVEIASYDVSPEGFDDIAGWFHFKGQLLTGQDCHVPTPGGGYTFRLEAIEGNFSIGFSPGNDLTFFEVKAGLVQVEFETTIPWIIDKPLPGIG